MTLLGGECKEVGTEKSPPRSMEQGPEDNIKVTFEDLQRGDSKASLGMSMVQTSANSGLVPNHHHATRGTWQFQDSWGPCALCRAQGTPKQAGPKLLGSVRGHCGAQWNQGWVQQQSEVGKRIGSKEMNTPLHCSALHNNIRDPL